jgi:hypothetical protein
VRGTAEAAAPDPDTRLRDLLRAGIDTARAVEQRSEHGDVINIVAPDPRFV